MHINKHDIGFNFIKHPPQICPINRIVKAGISRAGQNALQQRIIVFLSANNENFGLAKVIYRSAEGFVAIDL